MNNENKNPNVEEELKKQSQKKPVSNFTVTYGPNK